MIPGKSVLIRITISEKINKRIEKYMKDNLIYKKSIAIERALFDYFDSIDK